MCSKKISWRSCDGSSPDTWPELAYGVKGGQLRCLPEARGAPDVWLRRSRSLRWNSRIDYPSWVGEEPILGEGVGWCGNNAPPLHAQASTSRTPLSLHDPVLLMSSSTTPCRPLSYNPSLRNPTAGHVDVTPPCRRGKNWGSKFSLRWTKSWVMNQTCLQTSPSS